MRVVIGVRVFSLSATVITLAVEPMGVPLPPKPAPNASAHHSGNGVDAQGAQLLDDRDHGDGERDVVDHRRRRWPPPRA